jgi:hypothetical protein
MNLIKLFDSLVLPDISGKYLNSITVPNFTNFRIAIDAEGKSHLLLLISEKIHDLNLKNYKLKYLQLEQNLDCRIYEKNSFITQTFTVISFHSIDRNLIEYFLRISETLINTIGEKPTQKQIVESLNRFIEVFKTLSETPKKTISGLWSELFLIETSNNPLVLINYWHNYPEEKFDFNSGNEKIEVKSSSNFERKHFFSSEQLNPQKDSKIIIASMYLKQHNLGLNIQSLIERIATKIDFNNEALDKINVVVFRTLGNSFQQSFEIKFDYNIALQSLQFYLQEDIDNISRDCIPVNVSDVKFKSDLSRINSIELMKISEKQILFKAL